jgi:hypothetical protein
LGNVRVWEVTVFEKGLVVLENILESTSASATGKEDIVWGDAERVNETNGEDISGQVFDIAVVHTDTVGSVDLC